MGRKKQPLPEDALRMAYDEGWHDAAMARRVGVTDRMVRSWRLENNLPGNPYKSEVTELILQAYNEGCHDTEIARRAHVGVAKVRNWRHKHSLPSHYNRNRGALNKAEAYELYKTGLNDNQIAEELDVELYVVKDWRTRCGLPARG